jgi:hypothetical protein
VVLVVGVQGAPVVLLDEDEDELEEEEDEELEADEALFELFVLFVVDVELFGLSYVFVHANTKKIAYPNNNAI